MKPEDYQSDATTSLAENVKPRSIVCKEENQSESHFGHVNAMASGSVTGKNISNAQITKKQSTSSSCASRRPSMKKINEILKKRWELKIRMKELEEREIDFDDEVREDELLKQEIMVQKALVSIEVKLEQYGLLKDLDEDSRALLTGKANLRVTVSETGNQLLNAKLTDSLMEKQSKGIRTGLFLTVEELTSILIDVRSKQEPECTIPDPIKNPDGFDLYLKQIASLVSKSVREATFEHYKKAWDDYIPVDQLDKCSIPPDIPHLEKKLSDVPKPCTMEEISMKLMEAAQSERDEGNKVIPGSEYCDDGLELINEDHANEADDDEYSSEDKTCNEKSEVSSEEEVTDDVGTNITTTVMNVERTTANGNQQRMISIDSKISKVRSNDCNYEENILGSNDVSSIMQNSENCSPRTLVPLRTYSIESIEALASSNAELSPGTLLKEESGSSLVFHNDDKNVVVDTCSRIGDHEKGDINGEYREKANDKSSISGSVDDDVIVEYEDIKNVYEEGVGEINTEKNAYVAEWLSSVHAEEIPVVDLSDEENEYLSTPKEESQDNEKEIENSEGEPIQFNDAEPKLKRRRVFVDERKEKLAVGSAVSFSNPNDTSFGVELVCLDD